MKCKCNRPARLLQVNKQNENHGRYFYSCATGSRCNFFQWKDDVSSSAGEASVGRKRKASAIEEPSSPADFVTVDDLMMSYFLFTDGSCIGNTNVAKELHPAGWGVVAVRFKDDCSVSLRERLQSCRLRRIPGKDGKELVEVSLSEALELLSDDFGQRSCEVVSELFGPVLLDKSVLDSLSSKPQSSQNARMLELSKGLQRFSLGASVTSNNTAELCAMGEAFLWLQEYLPCLATPFRPKHCVVLYDSEYAAKSTTGEYNGKKNRPLIDRVREQFSLLRRTDVQIHFHHVKAHADHFFNERADRLANQGAQGELCRVGRYSTVSL